jgi:hypothetical protein
MQMTIQRTMHVSATIAALADWWEETTSRYLGAR